MSFSTWYYGKMKTSRRFMVSMAIVIAPIVYTAAVGAVFVQLFKNIWTCLVDCWFSVGGTISDVNRYYRNQVFQTPAKPKVSAVEDDVWGAM